VGKTLIEEQSASAENPLRASFRKVGLGGFCEGFVFLLALVALPASLPAPMPHTRKGVQGPTLAALEPGGLGSSAAAASSPGSCGHRSSARGLELEPRAVNTKISTELAGL